MTLHQIIRVLEATVLSGESRLDIEIDSGYASDLLSDVMANAQENQIWMTLQTHPNVVAVALLLNLGATVITGGYQPDPVTIEKAQSENIVLLTTTFKTFDAVIKLSKSGFNCD